MWLRFKLAWPATPTWVPTKLAASDRIRTSVSGGPSPFMWIATT